MIDHQPDELMQVWLWTSAQAAVRANYQLEQVDNQTPMAPRIADEFEPSSAELEAIRVYIARYEAWTDQRTAAATELTEANRRHATAYRLATGSEICEVGASVMAYAVTRRGAAAMTPTPPEHSAPELARPPGRAGARSREAGGPRSQARRSSARSGDSGDDGRGEPPAAPFRLAPPPRADERGQSTPPDSPAHRVAIAWLYGGAAALEAEEGER